MKIDFNQVVAFLAAHWIAIGGYFLLMVTSAVKTLPLPGQPFKVYTFLYDWAHQFFNITNTRLSAQPVITPPTSQPEGVESKQ